MRKVWSNSKSKPVTVIQSSNTPNPTTQPLAGKLSVCVCVPLSNLSPSMCLSVCIAWICLCFRVIYSCESQSVSVNLVQCADVWVCPSWFRSPSSFCMSVCGVYLANLYRFCVSNFLVWTFDYSQSTSTKWSERISSGKRGYKLTTFDQWSKTVQRLTVMVYATKKTIHSHKCAILTVLFFYKPLA